MLICGRIFLATSPSCWSVSRARLDFLKPSANLLSSRASSTLSFAVSDCLLSMSLIDWLKGVALASVLFVTFFAAVPKGKNMLVPCSSFISMASKP